MKKLNEICIDPFNCSVVTVNKIFNPVCSKLYNMTLSIIENVTQNEHSMNGYY